LVQTVLTVRVTWDTIEPVKGLNEPDGTLGALNIATAQIQSEVEILFAFTVKGLVKWTQKWVKLRVKKKEKKETCLRSFGSLFAGHWAHFSCFMS